MYISINEFEKNLIESHRAKKTILGYVSDLRQFSVWFENTNGANATPKTITSIDLREYKQYLEKIPDFAPRTINRKLASLRQFLYWANDQGMLPKGLPRLPGDVKTTQTQMAPKSLSKKQQDALERTVERIGSIRDIAIIKLFLHTGLRVSELCELKLKNVNILPRSGQVKILGKGGKYRELPLNKEARDVLTRYLEKHSREPYDNLFTGTRGPKNQSISAVGIRKMFRKYKRLAGIDDEGISIHSLRHTFATRMLENGRPLTEVKYLLGHENINTTAIYTKPRQRSLQEAVESLC